MEGATSNPVRSLPARELVDQGFIRPAEEGRYDYFAPDAAALLSDAFLDTHCFRLHTAPGSPDLIGLSFEPVRSQRPPDVAGTLWLDRETAKPRVLEFGYDWAPWEEARGVARGGVEFRELPSGAWIIPRWWIRMPTVGLEPPEERGDPGAIRLIGSLEVGWELVQVTTLDQQPVSPGATGSVRGSVEADASHDLLPGLPVVLRGTPYATHTDTAGVFFLDALAEGGFVQIIYCLDVFRDFLTNSEHVLPFASNRAGYYSAGASPSLAAAGAVRSQRPISSRAGGAT